MKKQELYDVCQGQISMLAMKEYSGANVISGKFGMIEKVGDFYDIWVTGVHLGKELSMKRVRLVGAALKPLCHSFDTAFNNELTCLAKDENDLGALAKIIGARKKRRMSQSQLDNLAKGRRK